MKKFKIIFFICFIMLLSAFMYLNNTRDLSLSIVDVAYSKTDVSNAIKIDSVIKDLGLFSEEDVTKTIINNGNSINFSGTTLSENNPKTTLHLRLSNPNINDKVTSEVECITNSNYINIYTDKDKYIINENDSISIVINIELSNNTITNNDIVDFNCKIVSSTM